MLATITDFLNSSLFKAQDFHLANLLLSKALFIKLLVKLGGPIVIHPKNERHLGFISATKRFKKFSSELLIKNYACILSIEMPKESRRHQPIYLN